MSQGPGRDGAPDSGQRPVLTGRPRKATNRSIAGPRSATIWAGPKRPARACRSARCRRRRATARPDHQAARPIALWPGRGPSRGRAGRRDGSAVVRRRWPSRADRDNCVRGLQADERGLQRDGGIAVGANGIVFDVVSGRPRRRRLVGEKRGEDPVHPDQVVDQFAHRPVHARGRP